MPNKTLFKIIVSTPLAPAFKEKMENFSGVQVVDQHLLNNNYSMPKHKSVSTDDINKFEKEHNLLFDRTRWKVRDKETATQKRLFILFMKKLGYCNSSIARCLDMDHSTITHHIKKMTYGTEKRL